MAPEIWYLIAGLVFSPIPAGGLVRYQPNARDVYVVAHQDDWQLFMGDVVAQRLRANRTATFIYLTAGDDGRDSLYWRTRELAALQSTQTASDMRVTDTAGRCVPVTVRAHVIRECAVGNTNSYFLRLPDGNRNGAGFRRYGNQSLRKLRRKTIASITAVDGSATYDGWDDLAATITALLTSADPHGVATVHTTDPSIAINPHDHFDHRMAGYLVADSRSATKRAVHYYVGYALGTRAANRTPGETRDKTAIFRTYDAAMIRVNSKWGAYAEHRAFYSQCMIRTYWRPARSPVGTIR
jgi:LmbE family N-acetylglucosaminyl deacetylase